MAENGPDRETVRAAVAMATRAPSVHNTQPWLWMTGDGSVHLFADETRRVPATDPDGRDLLLSCGAALHHLRVAAAATGWGCVVHRLPDPADPAHLAAVEMYPREPGEDDVALARAIERRRTDRRRFASWPVPAGLLTSLTDAAAQQGAFAVTVTDPAARFRLAGAIAQAAVIQESNPDHAVEIMIWSGRTRGASDGVLAAIVPAADHRHGEVRPRAFAHDTLAEPAGKRYGEVATLLVVATSGDDVLSRLRAGEATSAALLTATQHGMAACPLSQPLEIADTRRAIRDEVLGGSATPQLVLRLGWSPTSAGPLPRTPRRDLDEVLGDSTRRP